MAEVAWHKEGEGGAQAVADVREAWDIEPI
jgi:hypothetical protein